MCLTRVTSAGREVYLINTGTGSSEVQARTDTFLTASLPDTMDVAARKGVRWRPGTEEEVKNGIMAVIMFSKNVRMVDWHGKVIATTRPVRCAC